MEREGCGYDKMFEIQLREAKEPPKVEEQNDRVIVSVSKEIKNENLINVIDKIKNFYNLNQKEIICLGIIAQHKVIIATEFSKKIQSSDDKQIKNWLGKLLKSNIVLTKGKTKGMRYFVNPELLKYSDLNKTDLSNVEEHKLKALVLEDLEKYPNSRIDEIHKRIGREVPIRRLRNVLYNLVKVNEIKTIGGRKFRKYFIDKKPR